MDAFGIENHGYSPLISQKYVVKGDFEVSDGMDLLHHAMLNTLPNINKDGGKDEHGKTIRIPDFEARQKADTLITEIRQAFVEWLHAQPDDFKERLTDLYNRKFNCYVRPRYDGSHQQFPGLDLRGDLELITQKLESLEHVKKVIHEGTDADGWHTLTVRAEAGTDTREKAARLLAEQGCLSALLRDQRAAVSRQAHFLLCLCR